MMRVTEYTVYLEVPDDAQVGDTVEVAGLARVTRVAEPLIVTWTANSHTFRPDERTAKVSLDLRTA